MKRKLFQGETANHSLVQNSGKTKLFLCLDALRVPESNPIAPSGSSTVGVLDAFIMFKPHMIA